MKRLAAFTCIILALSIGFAGCADADDKNTFTVWDGLRSATIYVRVDTPAIAGDGVELSWKPAWISDSQRERLYWYGPRGTLISRIEIEMADERGRVSLPFSKGEGDYRLVVPGYSFRQYRAEIPSKYSSVLEPEKLHASLEWPSNRTVWTKAEAGSSLQLKSYRGQSSVEATFPDRAPLRLHHREPKQYRNYVSLPLPQSGQPVRIDVTDGGKFSLWIDRAINLFSQHPNQWFEPEWKPGEVTFEISDTVIGKTTRIGNYVEFAPVSEDLVSLLSAINPSVIHSYIFEDVMAKHFGRDISNHRILKQRVGSRTFELLSRTVRDSVPPSADASVNFLRGYVTERAKRGLTPSIISFVDEPNLRYRSFEPYQRYHTQLAQTIRSLNETLNLDIKIAAPESSRIVNGPTDNARRYQTGLRWTERLLTENWDSFDIISWHMWQHRYLEATDQYPETIEDVWQLNDRLANEAGKPAKELAISQTNLGSGPNTSTYQQNTHYASLWWASVVTQSIATGKLSDLIWFKAVDEGPYGKGILEKQAGQLARKPIADAMIFINSALLEQTLEAASSRHEVNLAAMQGADGKLSGICVNKSHRTYALSISAADWTIETLEILDKSGVPTKLDLSATSSNGALPITLPPRSLCAIKGRAKSQLAQP